MATPKKNDSAKALTGHMAKNNRREWEMCANTNVKRGKVWNQYDFLAEFDRYGENSNGASKAVHLLDNIVIKRHQYNGYIPHDAGSTGNQLIDEINCWLKYWDKPEADFLCPVLKYFTSKSDKVTATSDTMQENVVIIAQKAVKVGTAWEMCKKAYEMNGYRGETAEARYEALKAMSRKNRWRDAMHNGGNSGVIYDYHKGCYKAVFIDYAL